MVDKNSSQVAIEEEYLNSKVDEINQYVQSIQETVFERLPYL